MDRFKSFITSLFKSENYPSRFRLTESDIYALWYQNGAIKRYI